MYTLPPGYRAPGLSGAQRYLRNNGYVGGSIAYSGPPTQEIVTFTWNGVEPPDDGSEITIPDGPPSDPDTPTKVFEFEYEGTPGPGVIPLAMGGGTPTAAVTAAFDVLTAQLDNWTVTRPSALVLVLTYNGPGLNPEITYSDDLEFTIQATAVVTPGGYQQLLMTPGRFGKNYAFMPVALTGAPVPT